MSDKQLAAGQAMHRALCNLPCRCEVKHLPNFTREVTKQCQGCAAMKAWEEATKVAAAA